MGGRFKRIATGGLLVIGLHGGLGRRGGQRGCGRASRLWRAGQSHERAAYIAVGEPTRAPIGWVEFCIRYKPECDTKPSTARDVVLTPKAWSDMVKVNAWVNDNIKPVTDLEHWGVVEQWDYPDDGYGDCEDYVLLKRRMLMQAGWPREALLITVVRDKKGDGHAVLTVKTNRGEFILDNQESQILSWNKTGYRFVKRQSQSDPNVWVALGEPPRHRPRYPSRIRDRRQTAELSETYEANSRSRSRPHPSPSPDRVRERPALPQGPAAPLFASIDASETWDRSERMRKLQPIRFRPLAYCFQRRT